MAHDCPSSKHREIGCEVRKKGPSKTTAQHSLNLCNGYAAGNWANLPCKESPFCMEHFKGRQTEFQGASRHVVRRELARRCTFVSRSDRHWQEGFKMRDVADLGQSMSGVNTTWFLNIQREITMQREEMRKENERCAGWRKRETEKDKERDRDRHRKMARFWKGFNYLAVPVFLVLCVGWAGGNRGLHTGND